MHCHCHGFVHRMCDDSAACHVVGMSGNGKGFYIPTERYNILLTFSVCVFI